MVELKLLTTGELSDADADAGGGMTPSSPVDVAVASDPLRVSVTAPEDTMVSTIGVTEGVMTSSAPVEKMVEFEPEIVNVVAVEETMVSAVTEPLTLPFKGTDTLGAITPAVPVEKKVENTSMTVTLPSPPTEIGVGVTMPSVPVDVWVAVEKKVVTPASPSVVEAGTNVGPAEPPPPLMVVVVSPEMIVV